MIYPVIFRDKCSCGGDLYFVTEDDELKRNPNPEDSVYCMTCIKCKKKYSIKWNTNQPPRPVSDLDGEMSRFIEAFKSHG
jgi:hypothetical protein